MKLEIQINGQSTSYDIDNMIEGSSGVITIGQQCKNVWNAIAIDDEATDPFQCYLIGATGGPWKLKPGQIRTECPKGLISHKQIPCNGCTGRCVNIHPGRPKYYQRNPETQTVINGSPVSEYGVEINPGDIITFGNTTITVS